MTESMLLRSVSTKFQSCSTFNFYWSHPVIKLCRVLSMRIEDRGSSVDGPLSAMRQLKNPPGDQRAWNIILKVKGSSDLY